MRFYTKPHQWYCGIDLHARTMYVCILSQDGEIVLHRNIKTTPETFLKAIAPTATISWWRWNVCLPGTGWLIYASKKTLRLCSAMPSI